MLVRQLRGAHPVSHLLGCAVVCCRLVTHVALSLIALHSLLPANVFRTAAVSFYLVAGAFLTGSGVLLGYHCLVRSKWEISHSQVYLSRHNMGNIVSSGLQVHLASVKWDILEQSPAPSEMVPRAE